MDLLVCSFGDKIERAYAYSSRTLLDILLLDQQLLKRLHSIKSFFFLEQGDFFIQFVDSAAEELAKPLKDTLI
jgi:gamma-tubulin complex component 2